VLLYASPAGAGVLRQFAWASRVAVRCGFGVVTRTIDHDRGRRGHGARGRQVVEFVAVDPAMRGQGVARRLFEALHAGGASHWLETTRPENLPIFGRLGYRETSRRVEDGVTYFAMERSATS
jgi:ribosomal protein S18 acetylase RimI-like enzyme